jgi:hypothetical protein
MRARWIVVLALVALGACGEGGEEELSRQECEAVAAHLVVLEKLEGAEGGPMCKYHRFCDGADRRVFLQTCPRVMSRKQAHCYQRATSLAGADDCMPRLELDARVQAAGRGDGYGYGGSTFLGTTGGSRPQDRALRDLTALREDACRCRDDACATQIENRFQDLAHRFGDFDHVPGLRDRAQRLAEEAMKCLVNAMVPPDAGAPQVFVDPWAPVDAGPTAYRDPWAPDAGAAGSTGMPSCDQYLAAMEAYAACAQFPPSSRDSVRDSIESLRKGWADYANQPASARQAADDACRQAVDSVRQSAVAMGCAIP